MQLSCLRQIINILPAAIEDIRCFRYIHNAMHNKAAEVGYSQRYPLANAIQRSCADIQVYIPLNTMPSGLEIDSIEVIFVPEQYLKRWSMFIAFFDAALFYHTISEENQQRIVIKRNDIFNQLSKTLLHVFRKLRFFDWNKVVIILCTPSHGKHQKIKLIVFF